MPYAAINSYQNAIADFTKAISLNYKDHEIYYNRGIIYQKISKRAEANRDFIEAAKLGSTAAKRYLLREGYRPELWAD